MAYSLPELVLVGAAQNLVLQTSPFATKGTARCTELNDEDELEYDEEINW